MLTRDDRQQCVENCCTFLLLLLLLRVVVFESLNGCGCVCVVVVVVMIVCCTCAWKLHWCRLFITLSSTAVVAVIVELGELFALFRFSPWLRLLLKMAYLNVAFYLIVDFFRVATIAGCWILLLGYFVAKFCYHLNCYISTFVEVVVVANCMRIQFKFYLFAGYLYDFYLQIIFWWIEVEAF